MYTFHRIVISENQRQFPRNMPGKTAPHPKKRRLTLRLSQYVSQRNLPTPAGVSSYQHGALQGPPSKDPFNYRLS